jgi:hypothetical protein
VNRRRFLLAAGAVGAAVAVRPRSPGCPADGGESDPLPYGGVATHLWYFETQYGDTAKVAEHLRRIQAPIARDEWLLPEAWPEYRRRYLDALELVHTEAGTTFVMVAGRATDPIDPVLDQMEPYAELLAGIEGPNEWNLKGRPRWREELSAYTEELYAKVRDRPAFDGIPVVGPAIGLSKDSGPLFGDHSRHMDVGNFHFYQPATQVDLRYYRASLAGARAVSGDKPIVATELNGIIGDGHPGTEADQAANYRFLMELFGQDGIQRGFCYQLLDFSKPSEPLTHHENNFGCYRADHSAKPLAEAVREANLRDASPALLGERGACALGGAG